MSETPALPLPEAMRRDADASPSVQEPIPEDETMDDLYPQTPDEAPESFEARMVSNVAEEGRPNTHESLSAQTPMRAPETAEIVQKPAGTGNEARASPVGPDFFLPGLEPRVDRAADKELSGLNHNSDEPMADTAPESEIADAKTRTSNEADTYLDPIDRQVIMSADHVPKKDTKLIDLKNRGGGAATATQSEDSQAALVGKPTAVALENGSNISGLETPRLPIKVEDSGKVGIASGEVERTNVLKTGAPRTDVDIIHRLIAGAVVPSTGSGTNQLPETSSNGAAIGERVVHETRLAQATGDTNHLKESGGLAKSETDTQNQPRISAEGQTTIEESAADSAMAEAEGAPEWEADSSPYESSSDDSTDSSSEDDSDDDYEMLDPAEQARRLMLDDGGSDDEGGKKGGAKSEALMTKNEKPDEIVNKPDITVTPEMKIEELGNIEAVVDNVALIKAKTSGEYQVLESGSLLCLENRTVIGAVAETLGRVQEPLYCVRFPSASAMQEAGVLKEVTVFYVPQHSTFVFTKALQAVKGSDASNVHDEEVGDEEMEFSDDEAEAEYKRNKKLQKQSKCGDRAGGDRGGPSSGYSRGPGPDRFGERRRTHDGDMGQANTNGISYDDSTKQEDLYTPLARPTNLHEMMNRNGVSSEFPREGYARPSRGGRGRGDRGRGGADRGRGARGRGRGSDHRPPQHSSTTGLDLSLPATPRFGFPPALPPPAQASPTQQAYSRNGSVGTAYSPGLPSPQTPAYGSTFTSPPNPAFPPNQFYRPPQPAAPQGQSQYPYGQWPGQAPQQAYQTPQQGQGGQGQYQYTPPVPPPSNPAFGTGAPFQPGAFVNPAFFANQFQHQQQQQQQQPGQPPAQYPQGYQPPPSGAGQR